ncbi:MFS transporter [Nocardioides sp. AX2bis]|uniref:MFS transporter n=1 Tax=Nocardioides sp. AX2bis TaxID=2653157 RepID=UPI0012F3D8C9|nr:MFS transporter [Nocardioides sp. AX2bis]VXB89625.1 MFS transporter [Nocardioides sp. AX2bis]
MSPATRRRQRVTFAVLTVAVGAFALLQSMVVPVLSLIQVEYDTDQSTVTWVLTAYLLSASVATPLLGRIGDVVGKKRMLVVTLMALAVGSLLAALAPSIGWLIAARVVQGAGGGVLPLSFGIIRDEFGDKMTGALSVLASLTAVGFGLGIVVAGPVVDALGYHWLFWLPMGATLLAAAGAARFVPESPRGAATRLPLAPAVLLAGWLVALLLPVSQGNTWGWGSPRVIGLLALSAVLAAAWIRLETRVRVPLIDMHMMRRRGVWTTNLVTLFVGFGLFASFGFLPQLLQTPESSGYGFGASVTVSGQLLLPSAVASFLVGFSTSRLMGRFGARAVILTGALISGLSYLSLALFHDTVLQILVGITVQGLGTGLVISSSASVVIASVPASQTGVASGMNANIRTIGGSIGSAVMAGVVTARTGPGGFPAESGYTIGFAVLAFFLLLATLAATRVPDLHRSGAVDVRDDEVSEPAPAGA